MRYQAPNHKYQIRNGYTLVELIVAVGIFALVMTLAAGAYLVMIGAGRSAQATATGIDSLSFALEDMTRSIRTGSNYVCNSIGDCPAGGTSFSFQDASGNPITYTLSGVNGAILQNAIPLTDPDVSVTSLKFYLIGSAKTGAGDYMQPSVTIVVSGTVSAGPGKTTTFSVETEATMRTIDI